MHRTASVALGLLMTLQSEQGADGLARVFASAVKQRPVISPTFWPLLDCDLWVESNFKMRLTELRFRLQFISCFTLEIHDAVVHSHHKKAL